MNKKKYRKASSSPSFGGGRGEALDIKIIGPAYPFRGGLATYNERLATEFLNMGYQVDIETFSLQYPALLFPGKSQFSDGEAPPLNIKRTVNSISPTNWIKVGNRIKNEKPDVLLVRYWLPFMAPSLGTICRLVRKNKHTKVLCLADNIIPHEKRPGDNMLTRYFMKSIDGMVAMSQSVLDDIDTFNAKLPRQLCPHPLFDNYGEKLEQAEAKKKLKLDTGTSYLLFFGFIRDYKGLDLLLNAFAEERLKQLPVKLIVAGEYYTNPAPYQQLLLDLKLKERVIMHTDFIPNAFVSHYFSAADLVVQPYKTATQSGVTQIGYHFEKAMLVTNVGGLAEIIPDHKVGYVVEPNKEAIADAILDFYLNKRQKEFEKNLVEEKKKFSWQNMVNAFISVYNEISK